MPTPYSLAPRISCPDRGHHHLNIERLQAQPGMEEAVITEIDENEISLELRGIELVISGWGKLIGIGGPGDPSNELLEQIGMAIDAVRYEC